MFSLSRILTRKDSCVPPTPKLVAEAKAQLAPYQKKKFFVYQHQSGLIDTLLVNFSSFSQICDKDACDKLCSSLRAEVSSKAYPQTHFSIDATDVQNLVRINPSSNDWLDTTAIFAFVDPIKNRIDAYAPVSSQIAFLASYAFNNENLTAVKGECKTGLKCQYVRLPMFIVTKEKGLIEFIDNQNRHWILIN